MSKLPLILAPTARRDLNNIYDYTMERWSIQQADAYIGNIRKAIDSLRSMPGLGPEYREVANPVRILRTGEHLVIYRVEDGALKVLRIMHSRQNWHAVIAK